MKSIFLLGGLVGFGLVVLAGFTAGRDHALVLRDAALGAIVGGLLFRWFWRVLLRALDETALRRRAQAAADAENPAPAPQPARSR